MTTNIVWHDSASNETQLWLTSERRVTGRATVVDEGGGPIFVGPPWSIVGAGDFNHDGSDDLLWHNAATNETQIWFMNGPRITGRATVLGEGGAVALVGPPWSIAGVGDFDGNGGADILWHNSASGETQIWFMAGFRVTGRGTVVGEDGAPAFIGPPWSIVGTGQFNNNGQCDILWHNSASGETQIWGMNGARVTGRATVLGEDGRPALVGLPWSVVAGGDFNADGKSDILWHNATSNETQIWFVEAFRVTGRATVLGEDGQAAFVGPPWTIVAANTAIAARAFGPSAPDDCFEDDHNQKYWRFCAKCHGLAFDGYADKGRCPAGGGHQAAGYNFVLPHDLPDTPTAQANWRFCVKCTSMFFDGYPQKGMCAAGGAHQGAGYDFVLPHSLPATALDQDSWRFCAKCTAMFFDGYPDKGRCPQGGGHAAAGFNFALSHDIRAPFVFSAPIISGGLAALGGSVTLTVNMDGTYRWQGHAHDSGADNYDFGIGAVLTTGSGRRVAKAHSGHVSGTFSSGSRNEDWDETGPLPTLVSVRIPELTRAGFETNLNYDSGLAGTFETLAGWALKTAVGSVTGGLGAVIFIGLEIGSLIDSGSLVPGARLASGILWMAGPENTLFAIAAEGIVSAGSRTRGLTPEEYDWANQKAFSGALPPRDKLVLTDTIGAGNRAFTFPRADGQITLNMGPTAFDDPRKYMNQQVYGRTFIHELVHACQIEHSAMQVSLLADALASKICEATGGNPYLYGPAPLDYTGLNLEQQAQIVSDWFAGNSSDATTNHTGIAMDEASPYFEYIQNNVRLGSF